MSDVRPLVVVGRRHCCGCPPGFMLGVKRIGTSFWVVFLKNLKLIIMSWEKIPIIILNEEFLA